MAAAAAAGVAACGNSGENHRMKHRGMAWQRQRIMPYNCLSVIYTNSLFGGGVETWSRSMARRASTSGVAS